MNPETDNPRKGNYEPKKQGKRPVRKRKLTPETANPRKGNGQNINQTPKPLIQGKEQETIHNQQPDGQSGTERA